jgi:metallo-beta-lactamase class B
MFFLAALSAHGQADEEGRARNQPIPPFRIIGNIYYVGASDVTSFLITTPKGHILLDGGYKETAPQIEANVARLGFHLEEVKILLNSHAHPDHAGGLAELKQKTAAKLMVMENDADLLARGGKGDFYFGDRLIFPAVSANRVLHDGDKVELGGVTMTAHLTPGHTKGCTSWTTQVTENDRHYNVVFLGSISVPGYKLLGNAKYPTMKDDYAKTFALLKKLPCDVFLGSHGYFFSLREKSARRAEAGGANPFIDPEGYRTFLEESERAFREQLAREEKATR